MTKNTDTSDKTRPSVPCPLCGESIALKLSRGRKSGKPFISLVCHGDPRHLRGFIHDSEFVGQVVERLEQLS